MRNWQLQEDVAATVTRLWVRLNHVTAAVGVADTAAFVADRAATGDCTGDYLSDLVADLRDLVAVVSQYADTLDGYRVRLDAESLGAVAG